MYNLCHNATHEFGQRYWFGKLLWEQRNRNARNEWLPWTCATQEVAPWGSVSPGPHPEGGEDCLTTHGDYRQ